MGLFSDTKIINVSSSIYNMAGDEDKRPNFMKGTIFGSVISDSPSLADDITKSYFNGPGMKLRQFFRYADRNDMTGMPTATVVNNVDVDNDIVKGQIPVSPSPSGLILDVYNSEVNDGDFEPWIRKWIHANHPTRIVENWLSDFDPNTNMFSVEFPNNDFYSWPNTTVPVYSASKRYIVSTYVEYLNNTESSVVLGSENLNETSLPDVSGWETVSDTNTSSTVTLQRTRTTVWSYSNGDPDVTHEDNVDADVLGILNTAEEVYQREVPIQRNGIELQGERQIWNFTGTDTVTNDYSNTIVTTTDMGGGVIRTETSTTTGEQVTSSWTTRYDTQDIYKGTVYGGQQIFIYEIGTGNLVLDGLASSADASGFQEFFPIMPLRIDNVSLLEPEYDDLYAEMSKGYRRAFQGKNLEELIETVEDNESIDDIDYAYLMFGCSLNVKEMACRKYIWKFFEKMIPFQSAGSENVIGDMPAKIAAYNAALQEFENWESNSSTWDQIPDRPEFPKLDLPPTNTIKLKEAELGYDIRLQWIHIEVEQFNGTFDVDPNKAGYQASIKDDLKLENGPEITWTERTSYNNYSVSGFGESTPEVEQDLVQKSIPSLYIYWQVDSNTYRRMQIWGLTHLNYVYGGKAVKITSKQALADNDESGFIVPLHYPTMSEMTIVEYTQMTTACTFIVFNCYTVVIQKWYEKFIFQILIVITVIIIAVVLFPGAFAGGSGILGGNVAIGSALGLSGTAAIVAGVVTNYIASILISELLKIVGTALFGEKWGALFAAIVGFSINMGMSSTKLFSAKGLLGLGNALANGYAGWVAGDIKEMAEELEIDQDTYEDKMKYIQDLISGLGGNDLNFNPLFLTDSAYGNKENNSNGSYMPESVDEFIGRTTMTGTDIVELSHSMVYDFPNMQRTLPRN